MTSPAICPHCLTEVPISSHSFKVESDDFREFETDQPAAADGIAVSENQQATSQNESNTAPSLYICPGCGTRFSVDNLDATNLPSGALNIADSHTAKPKGQSSIDVGADSQSDGQFSDDDEDEFELSDLDLELELDPIPDIDDPLLELEDVAGLSEPNITASQNAFAIENTDAQVVIDATSDDDAVVLDESFAVDDESITPPSELLIVDSHSDAGTELDAESDFESEEPRPLIVFSVDDHMEDEFSKPQALKHTTDRESDIETDSELIGNQSNGNKWSPDGLTSDSSVTNERNDYAVVDASEDTAFENDLEIEDVVSDVNANADDVATIGESDINESNIESEAYSVVESSIADSENSVELVDLESAKQENTAEANTWELINAAARPRPKRPQASPIRKIVPPILGGLAAFPIATLIMWYGFGKDIGSAGPTVARYAPWIVPQHLRGKGQRFSTAPTKSATSTNESKSSKSGGTTPRRNGTFGELGSNNNGSNNNSKPTPAASSDKSPPSSAANKVNDATETKPLPTASEQPTTSEPTIPAEASAIATVRDDSERPLPSESLTDKTTSAPTETTDTEPDNALIPKSIQIIRDLKAGWSAVEKSSQKEKQAAVASLFAASRTIAEASSELRGRSGKVWRKEIDKSGKEILATPIFQKAIDMCATGLIKGITPPKKGEFATFVANVASFEINTEGQLALKLSRPLWVGTNQVIPKLLPESTSSTPVPTITSPTTCLLLGKIVEITDDESEASSPVEEKRWVLEVHLIVWPQ